MRIRQRRCDTSTGTWLSGLRQRPIPSASSPRASAQASVAHNRLSCDSTTPFGAPVEPDVYAMAATVVALGGFAADAARCGRRRRMRGLNGRSGSTTTASAPADAAAARAVSARATSVRSTRARAWSSRRAASSGVERVEIGTAAAPRPQIAYSAAGIAGSLAAMMPTVWPHPTPRRASHACSSSTARASSPKEMARPRNPSPPRRRVARPADAGSPAWSGAGRPRWRRGFAWWT